MIPPFDIFGKTFSIYGILAIIGIFVAGLYCIYKAKEKNLDENDTIVILLFCCIGILIGGNMLYGLTNYKLIIEFVTTINTISSSTEFFSRLITIFGGSVFYGGLIGGGIAAVLCIKHKGYSLADYSDILAPTIPLFHTFGRIGCFLGGCCYGIESNFGFTYTVNPITFANGVRRFPIQIVEASMNFALFLVLAFLLNRNKLKGKLIFIYLGSYAIARFIIEFFRGDAYRGIFLGISTSQYISIAMLLYAISGIIFISFKKKKLLQ